MHTEPIKNCIGISINKPTKICAKYPVKSDLMVPGIVRPKQEIIQIWTGGAGIRGGESYLDLLLEEHGIDRDGNLMEGTDNYQTVKIGTYFDEIDTLNPNPVFKPRIMGADFDKGQIDHMLSGKNSKLFDIMNTYKGKGGPTGNIWAKGMYTQGADEVESSLDIIRNVIEKTDCLQGFEFHHSIGGGTGGGFGCLLMSKLREEYPRICMSGFTFLPRVLDQEDSSYSVYNSVLSIHQLVENTDFITWMDNQALYNLCLHRLKIQTPTFHDMNILSAEGMGMVTALYRFPTIANSWLLKHMINYIPFPRLHFFMLSMAPISAPGTIISQSEIVNGLFTKEYMLADASHQGSMFLTGSIIYRGENLSHDLIPSTYTSAEASGIRFNEWMPKAVDINIFDIPCTKGRPMSGCFLASSGGSVLLYNKLGDRFTDMFRRKAYLQRYLDEGMDEMEFTEAESNMNDLVSEYQQYQDATCEEEGEFDDEEEYDEDEVGDGDDDDDEELREEEEKEVEEHVLTNVVDEPKEVKIEEEKKETIDKQEVSTEPATDEGITVELKGDFMIVTKNQRVYSHRRRY